MRRIFTFLLITILYSNVFFAQAELNLDFEVIGRDGNYPVGWASSGSHIAFLDDKIKKHGENAIRLENVSNFDEREWSYYSNKVILTSYIGKEITLRGYMKTENLKGSAGLYMHQQGGTYFKLETINLDNMKGRRLEGTNEWTPVIIKMPFPPNLYQIEFGVYIEGKGKVWVDDLKLLVDNKAYIFAAKRDPNDSSLYPKDKNLSNETTEGTKTPYYKQKAQETMTKQKIDTEKAKAKKKN